MKVEVKSRTDWFLVQLLVAVRMVPFSSIGLSSMFRAFDVTYLYAPPQLHGALSVAGGGW